MEVIGQLYATVALCVEKIPRTQEKETDWAPEPVWTLWLRYYLLPHQGIKPRMFQLLD